MNARHRVMHWLVDEWHWPGAALFTGVFLIALSPIVFSTAGTALALIYLQLPVYMFHQWEEHAGDKFRRYVNNHIAGGREALTPIATFWINSLGVWGIDFLGLYLAWYVKPSLGLMAIYLPLINSLGHVGPAIAGRAYNPGLWTSIALFLPIGGAGIYAVSTFGATWMEHLLGAGIAVSVHVAIIVHVARRIRRLSAK
jgi:hypothetical protein